MKQKCATTRHGVIGTVGKNSRRIAREPAKTFAAKLASGFWERYASGNGVDIGYKGGHPQNEPILASAVGLDILTPGYDGKHIPEVLKPLDYVFTSHTLEHLEQPEEYIAEWFSALKPGGYLIIVVPHRDLYERKLSPPSKWNADHRRFYTAASLLAEVERAIPEPNAYRIRLLEEGDSGYDYLIPRDTHATGQYEITLVIEKRV